MELTESLKHNLPSTNTASGVGRIGDSDTFYTEWEETYESFDQMGLHENLLRGIYAYGGFLAAVTYQQSSVYVLNTQHGAKTFGRCYYQHSFDC